MDRNLRLALLALGFIAGLGLLALGGSPHQTGRLDLFRRRRSGQPAPGAADLLPLRAGTSSGRSVVGDCVDMGGGTVAALVVDMLGRRAASFPSWAPEHADQAWAISLGLRADDWDGSLSIADPDRHRIDSLYPEPIYEEAPPCMRFARRYSAEQAKAARQVVWGHRLERWADPDDGIVTDVAHALGLWRFPQ